MDQSTVLRLLVLHTSTSINKVTFVWRSILHARLVVGLAEEYGAYIVSDGSGSLGTATFRHRLHHSAVLDPVEEKRLGT